MNDLWLEQSMARLQLCTVTAMNAREYGDYESKQLRVVSGHSFHFSILQKISSLCYKCVLCLAHLREFSLTVNGIGSAILLRSKYNVGFEGNCGDEDVLSFLESIFP